MPETATITALPADPAMPTVQSLEMADLHFSYRNRPVISGFSATWRAGEMVAIVGPNGCGKSTLLKLLVGSLSPARGRIAIDGRESHTLGRIRIARRMALVPQMAGTEASTGLGSEGGFTVRQVVLMSRFAAHVDESPGILRAMGGLGIFGFESEHDIRLAREAMWAADVHHLADRNADSLSGGERQRVALARAFAQHTPILLLDEPTSALDLFHQLELISQLRACAQAGRLVVLVTHDLNLAAEIATRVVVMDQGAAIANGPPAEVLTPEVLEPVYQVKVTAAEGRGGRLAFARRSP